MSISLTQPAIGSVGWGGAVNTNWASIEDAINNKLIASGSLASRPSPAASNAGTLYFATDAGGGTLYRSDGSSWSRVAPSVGATGYNYLINGGFDFAQRQTPGTFTTIADAAYGPDRWKCFRENADLQYSRTSLGSDNINAGWFKKTTGAGKLLFAQILESNSVMALRGQVMQAQITMQADTGAGTMRFGVLKWTGTADSLTAAMVSAWGADSTDPTFAASYSKITPTAGSNVTVANDACTCILSAVATKEYTFSFTVPDDANNLVLVVFANADFAVGDAFVATNAGLYPSAGDREWTPRLPGEELALCQRYCYVPTTPGLYGTVYRSQTRYIRGFFSLPTTLRKTPSASSNISGWDNDGSPTTTNMSMWNELAGAYVTITGALTVLTLGADEKSWFIYLQAGTSFSGTSGQLGWLIIGPDVRIVFDAEL